jgi:hypothetical protein
LVLRYWAKFGQRVHCNLVCSKTSSIENTHCLPAQLASVAHRQGVNYSQYSTQADSARMARICSGPMGGKGCREGKGELNTPCGALVSSSHLFSKAIPVFSHPSDQRYAATTSCTLDSKFLIAVPVPHSTAHAWEMRNHTLP